VEIRDRATFSDYLTSFHGRTRRVILCVPPAELESAPAPGKFSFGDIARHLAGIERYMYGETVQGKPSRYSGHGRNLADGFDNVVAYYDRLHEESKAIFAALSDAQLAGKCMTPAGTPITTWKWLRAMFEHEAHHRGQIYMMLALKGVKTPPLYGLTEEEVVSLSHQADHRLGSVG
jgi:uncharacterized damage-inducible protein DinB